MLHWVDDEFAIHVSITTRPSLLYLPFSEKLNNLLDRLDNRRTMHGFQCDAHEWVRGD
jgi:hypothetical protein